MYACDGGSYKIVELLLNNGADPNDAAKVHKIGKGHCFHIDYFFSRVMGGLH